MTTAVEEKPVEQLDSTTPPEDRQHVVCTCRPHVAFCGAYRAGPMSDLTADDSLDDLCPDCVELIDVPCLGCGA